VTAGWKSIDECKTIIAAGCVRDVTLPGTLITTGMYWRMTRHFGPSTCSLVSTEDTSCPALPYYGTLAAGDSCLVDNQCKSGECQISSTPSGCGTCSKTPTEGEACSTTIPCASYLWCDNGLCKTRTADGQACTSGESCLVGSLCSQGICTYQDDFVMLGGACSESKICAPRLVCTDGVCSEPVFPKEGESCTDTCASGLVCTHGTCKTFVPNQACDSSSPCVQGQSCGSAQKCVDRPRMGEACDENNPCELWLTCFNSVCGVPTQCK
jgi:hypothetical protein